MNDHRRAPCSSPDAAPPTRPPGRSPWRRGWPSSSSSSSRRTQPAPWPTCWPVPAGRSPPKQSCSPPCPRSWPVTPAPACLPDPAQHPGCSTPAWCSSRPPRSPSSGGRSWPGCAAGARHGCAAWPPVPKRTPCSVPDGSAGSRRSSAPTCTIPLPRLRRVEPRQVGWRLGVAHEPRGGDLWVPWDRTAGVIGPQGSGKTLDLLIPALLAAPGAALVTLTKADDLLLSIGHRSTEGARASCWTRSGSPRDCPSWSGTRWPGAWTRWSPRSAPRRSPPAPSPVPEPEGRVTTPPGSTPPRRPRSSRATSTPPP